MAPLKVAAAHRAGDLNALNDAISNFEDLGMGQDPPAIAAKATRNRITEERKGKSTIYIGLLQTYGSGSDLIVIVG